MTLLANFRLILGQFFGPKKSYLIATQLSPAAADVSFSAESVFGERRGVERPPPPTDVVAETPNETTASSSGSDGGGKDDSLNSSTASQVFGITRIIHGGATASKK